jgi:hypothetical protein
VKLEFRSGGVGSIALGAIVLGIVGCGGSTLDSGSAAGAGGTDTDTGASGSAGASTPGASGGTGVAGSTGSSGSSSRAGAAGSEASGTTKFSFFVTSWAALQRVSGSADGFGGDLRHGETGAGAGLRGADKICSAIAETSMPGSGSKGWHAFLSAADDGTGKAVNAIDRIGAGPWYDRLGRLFGNSVSDINATRPTNADSTIANDFPNEDGVPNHQPDPTQGAVDNHDTLTGSDGNGKLYDKNATCLDWTAASGDTATEGKPRVGHSWVRTMGGGGPGAGRGAGMDGWMSALTESGCKPGANLIETGPPISTEVTVGSGGGYGGFYCFASTP